MFMQNWWSARREASENAMRERGFAWVCVEHLKKGIPLDYLVEQSFDDNINKPFDEGVSEACLILWKLKTPVDEVRKELTRSIERTCERFHHPVPTFLEG